MYIQVKTKNLKVPGLKLLPKKGLPPLKATLYHYSSSSC